MLMLQISTSTLLKRGFQLRFKILFTSPWTRNNRMKLAMSLNNVFYYGWMLRTHIHWWHTMFVQSLLIFLQFNFLIFQFSAIPSRCWVGKYSYSISIPYHSVQCSSLWCSANSRMNLICRVYKGLVLFSDGLKLL